MRRLVLTACAVPLVTMLMATSAARPVGAQAPATTVEDALTKKARAIHERVIALDTHNDISPTNFQLSRNYTIDLGNQVNLPKMKEGGLDASFFIVYVGQTSEAADADAFNAVGYRRAYDQAVEKFEAIHRLTKILAPDQIELALTAADVPRIAAKGKKVALIGIENGYPVGEDIRRVKEFWERGGRYMSLAHNGHSQLSDSNTGERDGVWKWNGLSPLGKQVIAEMNKWGIMVDVSHPSKESMMQTLAITQAPIIASHSAVRALCDHSRNMDDEQLLALKKNGGVIQTVAFGSYVKTRKPDSPERAAAIAALRKEFGLPEATQGRGGRGREGAAGGGTAAGAGAATGATTAGRAGSGAATGAAAAPGGGGRGQGGGGRGGRGGGLDQLSEEKRGEFLARMADIDKKMPGDPPATVKDFVDHIDYAVKKIGLDHVGISSDFDGGGGVQGWNDASETFNVTLELVRRGYTEPQIAKLWSGNLLRVMADVERVAKKLQKQS